MLEAARRGSLSEARVAEVARSILRFLAQCHAKGIVFRDVKVREQKEFGRETFFSFEKFFLFLFSSLFRERERAQERAKK